MWREFVLRPAPLPEAARRQAASELASKPAPDYWAAQRRQAGEWWRDASSEKVAAGFAVRRQQLRRWRTAQLVTRAHLDYSFSAFQLQARRSDGWQLREVLRMLPSSLAALEWASCYEDGTEGRSLLAARFSDALTRFPHLTELKVCARTSYSGWAKHACGAAAISKRALPQAIKPLTIRQHSARPPFVPSHCPSLHSDSHV